jgi:hypothetical protein
MLEEGFTGERICGCTHDTCMTRRWEELEASLDEAEMKGWVIPEATYYIS